MEVVTEQEENRDVLLGVRMSVIDDYINKNLGIYSEEFKLAVISIFNKVLIEIKETDEDDTSR